MLLFNCLLFIYFKDVIAIPDFAAGAMENWGLITYREVTLLYDDNYPSIKQEQYVVGVVAHELAHQVNFMFFYTPPPTF